MPFKSKAQRRKFYAMAERGEISDAKVKEWEDATHGKKLPERVKKAVETIITKTTPPPVAVMVPSTVGTPTLGKLKGTAMRKISTYDCGANTALQTIGLIKEARGEIAVPLGSMIVPPFGGAIAGGAMAPEGQGWRGAGGAGLGSMLGGVGGYYGGRTLGGLTGKGIAKLVDADPELGRLLGRIIGGAAGGLAGAGIGGYRGFRAATDEPKKKNND